MKLGQALSIRPDVVSEGGRGGAETNRPPCLPTYLLLLLLTPGAGGGGVCVPCQVGPAATEELAKLQVGREAGSQAGRGEAGRQAWGYVSAHALPPSLLSSCCPPPL